MKNKTLFLNHRHPTGLCGIYDFGKRISNILSTNNSFIVSETGSYDETLDLIEQYKPNVTILNCHPEFTRWIKSSTMRLTNSITVGLYHEVGQKTICDDVDELFDYYLCTDMSLDLSNTNRWFKVPKPLILNYMIQNRKINDVINIGSFGFFLPHKGFDDLIIAVNKEFEKAIINIHAPIAFADKRNKLIIEQEKQYLFSLCKNGIQLNITDEYLSDMDLVKILSNNDINIFLYKDNVRGYEIGKSGVSGVIDHAICANKPILTSNSDQFRHVKHLIPQYPEYSILDCINYNKNNNNSNLIELFNEFSWHNFNNSIDKIINIILGRK